MFEEINRSGPCKPIVLPNFQIKKLSWLLPVQIAETGTPGTFRMWALVGQELHQLKLNVPRILYINYKEPRPLDMGVDEYGNPQGLIRKCTRTLPRSRLVHNLYEFVVPEPLYRMASK